MVHLHIGVLVICIKSYIMIFLGIDATGNIILSKITQSQKDKYGIILLISGY